MKNLRALFATILIGAMLLTTSCGKSAGGSNPSDSSSATKDVLTVAMAADPNSLDPYGTTDLPAARISSQIFETLVNRDAQGNIVPGLAESWDIVDSTTYIFHLRQGVQFHNGETLTAKDVEFSFRQLADSPHASSLVATIDFSNCKAVDDYTFEMKMTEPFGPILNHLCHTVMAIVNEKAYTEAGSDVGQNPIGTGPYKFVLWKTADRVELTAFDEYWGDKARVKNLTFRTIPETASREIEVETGGVDVAIQIMPSAVEQLESKPNVKVSRQETYATSFIAFTANKAPMDNLKVRQAINYAINLKAIQEVVFKGTGAVGIAPMSPTIWAYNDQLPPYDYNPEKAKQLLEEAGFPNGFSITLSTDEHQERLDVAEMVQAQLAEVGIQVEIITLERGKFIENVYSGAMEMFMLGWSASTGDPDYALYASFHSSMFGEGGNMSFYANPEVDTLLEKGRTSTDEAERKEAYLKAQEIIWSEAPCVFYLHAQDLTAYNAALQGFNSSPDGLFDFSKMYFA